MKNGFRPNDQLTDGGPSVVPELPSCVAGPPFGGAPSFGAVLFDSTIRVRFDNMPAKEPPTMNANRHLGSGPPLKKAPMPAPTKAPTKTKTHFGRIAPLAGI